jgi:hypothetical protein
VDLHYNPPGIRGEPRYLEGVVKLTKLHGSLEWRYHDRTIVKASLPFGATESHPDVPSNPLDTVMIYPNAAKDYETIMYPYADLFRDMAAAICRPNSALVVYGYGFGDDHINRVIEDFLTIPSTHLVILAFSDPGDRIWTFCDRVGRESQMTLLLGEHFGSLSNLVGLYLPTPAIDPIAFRRSELLSRRATTSPAIPPAAGAI